MRDGNREFIPEKYTKNEEREKQIVNARKSEGNRRRRHKKRLSEEETFYNSIMNFFPPSDSSDSVVLSQIVRLIEEIVEYFFSQLSR